QAASASHTLAAALSMVEARLVHLVSGEAYSVVKSWPGEVWSPAAPMASQCKYADPDQGRSIETMPPVVSSAYWSGPNIRGEIALDHPKHRASKVVYKCVNYT